MNSGAAALSFRLTLPDDLPALAGFFADRFGHPWEPEEWHWKYQMLPGESRSWVAADASGELLAHAGALCLPARRHGSETRIWQLVDWAGTTRGGGLRPALVELGRRLLADLPRETDAPWIFGFPSERHFRLGQRVFGYKPLQIVEEWAGDIPDADVGSGLIETGDSCGDWAERIWEACHVNGVRRSAAFLNWRYYTRPGRYYRFYRLDGGGVEGLVVFSFLPSEAWAAEVWLPPGGDWTPGLHAVAADLRAAGFRRWRFWSPPAGLGLQTTGERRFIGCRGRATGPDPVAAAAGFFYAMGDYDLV